MGQGATKTSGLTLVKWICLTIALLLTDAVAAVLLAAELFWPAEPKAGTVTTGGADSQVVPVAPSNTPVTCIASRYTHLVIVGFRHKGFKALYERDSIKGVQAAHASKLRRILSALDVAQGPRGLDIPGFQIHPLSGRLADH